MKNLRNRLRVREEGIVAVEFAIALTFVILPLLAGSLFFGRVFWHYTVAAKAAHDAARFISAAAPGEMKKQGSGSEPPVVAAARDLAQQELSELSTGGYRPDVAISCDGYPSCSVNVPTALKLPQKITVSISINVEDPFFGEFTTSFFGDSLALIPLQAVATVNYVAN
jgi:hypothetical protein